MLFPLKCQDDRPSCIAPLSNRTLPSCIAPLSGKDYNDEGAFLLVLLVQDFTQ